VAKNLLRKVPARVGASSAGRTRSATAEPGERGKVTGRERERKRDKEREGDIERDVDIERQRET
jgi:hypothetical protein